MSAIPPETQRAMTELAKWITEQGGPPVARTWTQSERFRRINEAGICRDFDGDWEQLWAMALKSSGGPAGAMTVDTKLMSKPIIGYDKRGRPRTRRARVWTPREDALVLGRMARGTATEILSAV